MRSQSDTMEIPVMEWYCSICVMFVMHIKHVLNVLQFIFIEDKFPMYFTSFSPNQKLQILVSQP